MSSMLGSVCTDHSFWMKGGVKTMVTLENISVHVCA